MIEVTGLIWDEWNKKHIQRHNVTTEEIEEVCHSQIKTYKTYRGRIEVIGETRAGRKLKIILSPEDRNLQQYEKGFYYPVTAFEEGDINESKE